MESNADNRCAVIKEISTAGITSTLTDKIKYDVLLLTDTHFGVTYDVEKSKQLLFAWLKEIKDNHPSKMPSFCIILGDIADYGKKHEYAEYENFARALKEFGIKEVFCLAGNHDIYNNGWEYWKQSCYPSASFYKFSIGDTFVWYSLDSASGSLGKDQYKALKASMENESKIPIVMTHYPLIADESILFAMRDTTERNLLISLFSRKSIAAYFCGHYHLMQTKKISNFTQYSLQSFGEYQRWFVLQVNETNKTIQLEKFGT